LLLAILADDPVKALTRRKRLRHEFARVSAERADRRKVSHCVIRSKRMSSRRDALKRFALRFALAGFNQL